LSKQAAATNHEGGDVRISVFWVLSKLVELILGINPQHYSVATIIHPHLSPPLILLILTGERWQF